jgi:CHASE2 domain-containing sensor protein
MSPVARERFLQRLRAATVSLVRRLGARTYLILAVVFSVLIVADVGLLNLVSAAETRLFDLLISHRISTPKPDPDIVILDIDEASLAGMAAEHGRWPWPNSVFGELVQEIEKQKPRAIVFDVLFSDRDTQRPESDATFNAVIARSATTFFPMLRLDPQNDRLSRIPAAMLPGVKPLAGGGDPAAHIAMILPKVPAAIDNGRLGTHQVTPDKDGVIRRYPAWLEHAGWRIPSLPQRITDEFAYAGVAELDRREVLLNWRGPPFTYRYISLVDLYRDMKLAAPQRPANEFAGKIIVIGSTAPSLFDVKGTPLARIHPGVEILATAIDNFKNGDALHERPAWVMIGAALLLIWGMAIALYNQIHIDVFDKVFGVLQAGLVLIAYAVVNLSAWYLDTSAPLSLGVMYFTVARIYYGVSQGWLADSRQGHTMTLPRGNRLLAVLALRLDGAKAAERRRFKGELDRLVAGSALGAGRISRLIEDPGFVQDLFADTMLVYWLADGPGDDWQADADRIEAALRSARPKQHWNRRIGCARHSAMLTWQSTEEWKAAAASTILAALSATFTPPPETTR